MFNLDPAKLLIIAVVVVVLLGPDKLPQVARQIGGAWRTLNEYRRKLESDVRESIPDLPSSHEIATYARSPSTLLHRLAAMNDSDQANAAEASANGTDLGSATGTGGAEGAVGATNGSTPTNGNGTGHAAEHAGSPDLDVPAFGDPSLN